MHFIIWSPRRGWELTGYFGGFIFIRIEKVGNLNKNISAWFLIVLAFIYYLKEVDGIYFVIYNLKYYWLLLDRGGKEPGGGKIKLEPLWKNS